MVNDIMNTKQVYFPDYLQFPPITLMDPTLQTVTLWASFITLGICLIFAARMGAKYKTLVPVLFFVAGFCNIVLEPFVDRLGHCIFAIQGQLTLFETNGHPIPLFAAVIYSFYFGAIWLILYPRYLKKSLTSSFIWKLYLANCLFAFVLEILPVKYGLWVYYGHQPLWLGPPTLSLFWTMLNPVCILTGFTFITRLHYMLRGWKQILLIPLSMSGAIMGHIGAGFPYYSVANSSLNTSPLIIQLSGILSIGMGLLIVKVCIDSLIGERKG
jgi:hypothetical protein